MTTPAGPRVFVSYASPDEVLAARLASDLKAWSIHPFFAREDIQLGENFALRLSSALADSDYYVLLVSAHSAGRRWVEEEWSNALVREINERRAFLFLLRLDSTPPPAILAARNYLDAFRDWDASVRRLAETWQRDWQARQTGEPVLPSPKLPDSPPDAIWGIYVSNKGLSVQHFLRTSPHLFCWQLQTRIRAELDLKDDVSILNGKFGMRFSYSFFREGAPLDPRLSLPEAGIQDGTVVDLVFEATPFGTSQTSSAVTYRDRTEAPLLTDAQKADLLFRAFGHLLPY